MHEIRYMIITDRFEFVHMHQTGRQTLHDVIRRCISECRIVGHRGMVPPKNALHTQTAPVARVLDVWVLITES